MKIKSDDISICPNKLKPILKAVNQLPKDLKKFEDDLNELSGRYDKEYLKTISNHDNKLNYDNELLQNDWLKLRSIFCNKLRQIITPKLADLINMTEGGNSFENARLRLRRLINEKTTLLNIIGSFQVWNVGYNRQMILKPTFNLDKSLSAYSFNEDTSLELLSFEVLEILTTNKIPIDRIRICRACRKNIFWAKRSDSPTCSSKCSNTFNTRKTRINKRINAIKETLDNELKELEKQKVSLGSEHPTVNKQMGILNKLYNKLDKERLKNGTT